MHALYMCCRPREETHAWFSASGMEVCEVSVGQVTRAGRNHHLWLGCVLCAVAAVGSR